MGINAGGWCQRRWYYPYLEWRRMADVCHGGSSGDDENRHRRPKGYTLMESRYPSPGSRFPNGVREEPKRVGQGSARQGQATRNVVASATLDGCSCTYFGMSYNV